MKTSGDYNVTTGTGVTSDSFTGNGTLANRFSLGLTSADGGTTMGVGSFIEATVTWDAELSTLAGVTFYLDQCQVQTGILDVGIVNGGCYSKALSVSPTSSTANTMSLSYMAFTAEAGKEQTQNLQCTVTMCMETCVQPASNADCPTSGTDAMYQYTITGV